MESGAVFEKYGLPGIVIGCLFYALYKMYCADLNKDSDLIKQHDAERTNWHSERLLLVAELKIVCAEVKALAIALTELTAKLPSFCGERRSKQKDDI